MASTLKNNTKFNLLTAAFIFALFAAFVTPVIFEGNAWRWYACGGFGIVSVLALYVQHRAARFELARTPTVDTRKPTRGSRIISGAGIIVIGTVVAMLLRDPSADRKMLRILIGFLFTSVAIFASTFMRVHSDIHDDESA